MFEEVRKAIGANWFRAFVVAYGCLWGALGCLWVGYSFFGSVAELGQAVNVSEQAKNAADGEKAIADKAGDEEARVAKADSDIIPSLASARITAPTLSVEDHGYAEVQLKLAYRYETGNGVRKDLREAARLYRLAADQGNAAAQSNLADFYERGNAGLPKNVCEAVRLRKLAAAQGNPVAQKNLKDMRGSRCKTIAER